MSCLPAHAPYYQNNARSGPRPGTQNHYVYRRASRVRVEDPSGREVNRPTSSRSCFGGEHGKGLLRRAATCLGGALRRLGSRLPHEKEDVADGVAVAVADVHLALGAVENLGEGRVGGRLRAKLGDSLP